MVSSIRIVVAAVWLFAAISMGQQVQQPQQAAPVTPPAAPSREVPAASTDRTRSFLGLGVKPDAEAAKRGAPMYASNCAFCHGPSARGAEGPSLLTSDAVLADDHGEKLVPFLHQGRPSKGMPSFAQIDDSKLKDITEFLHLQVDNYANRGAYKVANILTGNPEKGKVMFDARCSSCHSTTGDLLHIGSKFKPLDLQRYWISPDRNSPTRDISATVSGPEGTVSGKLTKLDDFEVTVIAAGTPHTIARGPAVKVELKDPLAFHMQTIPTLQDDDIHNMTAHLEKQK